VSEESFRVISESITEAAPTGRLFILPHTYFKPAQYQIPLLSENTFDYVYQKK